MLARKNIIDLLIVVMTAAMVALIMCGVHQASYQSGFNTAKSLVENSSLGAMMRTPDDIRVLWGTVTAVGTDRITIHTTSNNPFDALSDRTAFITTSTKISKITQKDPKVLQNEIGVSTKAIQSGSLKPIENMPLSTSSTPFTLTTIDLASIKVGDTVMITTSINIKSLKTFTADTIQIQGLSIQIQPANLPVQSASPSTQPASSPIQSKNSLPL